MAWTNITNAQLAVGAPVRSVDLLALRDNITAQANGDAGAPQQQTAGIADNAVTAAKVNKGNGLGTSGTQLVVACPTIGSVGSYAFLDIVNTSLTANSNYSSGLRYSGLSGGGSEGAGFLTSQLLSSGVVGGTWKAMGTTSSQSASFATGTLMCRVA